jgi:hypothetical protein
MELPDGTTLPTRRDFCLRAIAGTAAVLLGGALRAGETLATGRGVLKLPGKTVLCRNPAYSVGAENGQTCLGTMTKQGQRLAFAVDAGGLAVWHALPGPADIEAGRGLTVDHVVDAVATAFPKLPAPQVREGVLGFLDEALAAGVVLPTDKKMFCRARARQTTVE